MSDQDSSQPCCNRDIKRYEDDIGDIKSSIKQLAEAFSKFVILEERQANMAKGIEETKTAIQILDDRLDNLDKKAMGYDQACSDIASLKVDVENLKIAAPASHRAADWIDRLVFLVVGGVVMFLIQKALGG